MRACVWGLPKEEIKNFSQGFLAACLQLALDEDLEFVSSRKANLIICYPYLWPKLIRGRIAAQSVGGLLRGVRSHRGAIRKSLAIFGVQEETTILWVSHENLEAERWTFFREAMMQERDPRLTFCPSELDAVGFRLPYWWTYVSWPQLRLQYRNPRFGRLYDLGEFYAPVTVNRNGRLKRAIWLTRHLNFPRRGILESLSKHVSVDVVKFWDGPKEELLRRYNYCVVSENSVGYGYETEKMPEAWASGCIPIGYIPSPYCSFNPAITQGLFDGEAALRNPLLTEELSLTPLLEYLSAALLTQ